LEEIRRESDGELEGFVRDQGDYFDALTVFHGLLGRTPSRADARAVVHARGLGSLAERWFWRSRKTGAWAVVVPQEVRPGFVRVSVGYYALAGTPTAVITAADLADGDVLTLERPDSDVTEGMP
jgi:hypothetical protein